MENKKPLKYWTLAECKEYCKKAQIIETIEANNFRKVEQVNSCISENCDLFKYGVCRYRHIFDVDLTQLTENEKNIMRTVGAKFVTRDTQEYSAYPIVRLWSVMPSIKERIDEVEGTIVRYWSTYIGEKPDDCIGLVNAKLFPSVTEKDCIELIE